MIISATFNVDFDKLFQENFGDIDKRDFLRHYIEYLDSEAMYEELKYREKKGEFDFAEEEETYRLNNP